MDKKFYKVFEKNILNKNSISESCETYNRYLIVEIMNKIVDFTFLNVELLPYMLSSIWKCLSKDKNLSKECWVYLKKVKKKWEIKIIIVLS